ncbi:hypothetical protein DL98DRAFT_595395 [Cadophora sp. DSE1049]|nr:hypothetical protein DL98DRAFT_595395 [Cadophora sp. DSE1049]
MRFQTIVVAALAVGVKLATAVPVAGAESEIVAREPQGGQRGGKGYGGQYIRSDEDIVARDPQGGQRGGKGYGGQYIRSEESLVARNPQGGQRGGKGYGGQYI